MADLYKYMSQLNNDEICLQIALLRSVSIGNAVKEQSQKAFKAIFETIGEFVNPRSEEDEMVQLVSVKGLVEQEYEGLKGLDRETLMKLLLQELVAKCNAVRTEKLDTTIPTKELWEAVSVAVLNEAAKVYNINEYLPPLDKADMLHTMYDEHFARVLKNKILRWTKAQQDFYEKRIQTYIIKGDINNMRQLANELAIREFNGKTIVNLLMRSKGTTTLKKLLKYMGIGVFDGVECIIATAFDSVLSLHRVERALLCELVWEIMNHVGSIRLFGDTMPSYIDYMKQDNPDSVQLEKERRILNLIAKEKDMDELIKTKINYIRGIEKKIVSRQQLLNRDQLRLLEHEENKKHYQEFADSINNAQYYLDSINRNIDNLTEAIKKHNSQIEEYNETISKAQDELIYLSQNYNNIITSIEDEIAYQSMILQKRWSKAFNTLTFDKNMYGRLFRGFILHDIVNIERLLTEMNESLKLSVYGYTKKQVEEGIRYTTYVWVAEKKVAQISYIDRQIVEIIVKR